MAIPVAQAPICWPLSFQAETATSDHVSAACYRGPEDIGVVAVCCSGTEIWQRKAACIFFAHLVERAAHAAFEDRPEAFNRVGVNRTNDIFAAVVTHKSVRIFLAKPALAP
jgi:hypothetical protein